MKPTRTLLGVGLLTALLVAMQPTAVALFDTQGAAGVPVNPFCAPDGEVMAAQGNVMFFPHDGCAANYPAPTVPPTAIVFGMTSWPGNTVYCGSFEFSGGYTGTSLVGCAANGATVCVPVAALPTIGGGYTLTWRTAAGTPTWVNAWLIEIQGVIEC